jgi:FkbM family methyltransferase
MLREKIYQFAQATLLKAGLRVSFNHPVRDPAKLMAFKAAEFGVTTVLDIGANFGQFARALRAEGYSGKILSFEPLSTAHAQLSRNAADDPNWYIAPKMALGEVAGVLPINISHNLASSSLLDVDERSVQAAPESGYSGTEDVEVCRLDDAVAPEFLSPYAIKLDTQGFELHVLRGAPTTLEKTRIVVVEMSLARLYSGGATFIDVYRELELHGFRCISLTQGFSDVARNEMLQVDGVFVRDGNRADRQATP